MELRVPQDRDGRFSTELREVLDRKFAVLQEVANGMPLERTTGWERIRVSVPLGAVAPPRDREAEEW
jgi:hypothetical protein